MSKKEDFKLYKTDQNLKMVYMNYPYTNSTLICISIKAGSVNDGKLKGIAHFFEHMLFKGTEKKSPIELLNAIENKGGEMNAYTTKENTVLYCHVTNNEAIKALKLLLEMAFYSTFPEKELKKEKNIIAEEINMYLDTPEENIYDEFQELVYQKHPLGSNILGTLESIKQISRNDLIDFHQNYYKLENIVVGISTSLSHEIFLEELNKFKYPKFSFQKPESEKAKNYNIKSVKKEIVKKTDFLQSHIILGTTTPEYDDNKRYAMMFLNNILGGPSMNSVLNLEIREKHAMAYQVETGFSYFTNTGLFHCYLSTDNKNMTKSVDLVYKELEKFRKKAIKKTNFKQYINQFKGQIILAEENRSHLLHMHCKNILMTNKSEYLIDLLHKIDLLTPKKILELSQEVFGKENLSYLAYVSE